MDVKSTFLNGLLDEEVYISQPPDFKDLEHPDHVFKLNRALHSLKQPPRTWYDSKYKRLCFEKQSKVLENLKI